VKRIDGTVPCRHNDRQVVKRKPCLIENCDTCAFRAKAMVCDLEGDDLAEFQNIKHSLDYEPHQTVFYEGHLCLGLYLLRTGKVKLTRSSARCQRKIVRILGPGELIEKHAFGERALNAGTHMFDDRGRDKRGGMTAMFRGVNRMQTLLMSRAGESKSAKQSEDKDVLPTIAKGGGHHAGSEEKQEHWSEVCRSCDRVGARCLWCVAGFGS
jgi:general stress protein YciG